MTQHISTKQHTLALSQHVGMFFIVTPIILSYSQQVVWAPDMVFKCNVLLTKRPRLRFFLQTEWMRRTVCHSASVSLMLSLNTWGIMFLWPPLLNASFLLLSLRSCWQSGPNFIPPVPSRRAWVSWLESDKPFFLPPPNFFLPLLSFFLPFRTPYLLLTWAERDNPPMLECTGLSEWSSVLEGLERNEILSVVWCCPVAHAVCVKCERWNRTAEFLTASQDAKKMLTYKQTFAYGSSCTYTVHWGLRIWDYIEHMGFFMCKWMCKNLFLFIN